MTTEDETAHLVGNICNISVRIVVHHLAAVAKQQKNGLVCQIVSEVTQYFFTTACPKSRLTDRNKTRYDFYISFRKYFKRVIIFSVPSCPFLRIGWKVRQMSAKETILLRYYTHKPTAGIFHAKVDIAKSGGPENHNPEHVSTIVHN